MRSVSATWLSNTAPGGASSKYPAGPLPCTAAMRVVPSVVAGQAGMANTSATAMPASSARESVRTSSAPGNSTRRATSQTMAKLRPEIPSQATSGASGLTDCDSATRPHEKPPYGQVPVTNSRSTHNPPTITGSSPSRPSVVGNARGTQRYARVIRMPPTPQNSDSRVASAIQGTGPR